MKQIILKIVIILVISNCALHTSAQKFVSQNKKILHVGDQMPDHVFSEIINADQNSIKLTDYKGKLVILDFWNSTCISCIELMPHMQEIQDKFKDRVQIILVNTLTKTIGDTKEKTEKILENLEKNKGVKIKLPISMNDDLLDSYFPTTGIPMQIWIDGTGQIIARTASSDDVTETNITEVSQGKQGQFHMFEYIPKGEENHPFSFTKGKISFADDDIQFQSVIYSGKIGNFLNGLKLDSMGNCHGAIITNESLITLYGSAYPEVFKDFNLKNINPQVKDSKLVDALKLFSEKKFCWDLYTFKPIDPNTINSILRRTIEDTFGKLHFNKMSNGDLLITDENSSLKKTGKINKSLKQSKPMKSTKHK